MKKKAIWSILALAIGLAFFVWAIKYIGLQQLIDQFSRIKPQYVAIYLTVSIIIVIVLIVKWSLILNALGYKISFFKLLMYRQMGYAVGYVVPAFYIGGETVRSYFLHRKHDIPLHDAISSVVIDRAVELPMNFLLAAIMFFFMIFTVKLPLYLLIIIGVVILAMIIAITLFYIKTYRKEYFFTAVFDWLKLGRFKKLAAMRQSMVETETSLIRFFNHKVKYVVAALIISLLLWGLMMLEFWTALRIINYPATLVQIFIIIIMTGVAMAIPIPASVGVMEIGQIGICIMMGIPPAVAVALSLLVRTRDLMWILTGLGYYLYSGTDYVKMLLKDMQLENGKGADAPISQPIKGSRGNSP